jgi:salicylate hydroxylase
MNAGEHPLERNENGSCLHILIVGAGICGLSAATALRAHHHVTILERSPLNEETGAAITSNPSYTRILESWGFSFEDIESPEYKAMKEYAPDGTLHFTVPMEAKERYNHGFYMSHRVDVHQREFDI